MIVPDRSLPVPDEVLTGLLSWSSWRGCDSKVLAFATWREARLGRRWVFLTYGVRTRGYRCQRCGRIHLTKGPRQLLHIEGET